VSSEQAMAGALQTRLLTLGWDITRTALEGKTFTPVATQAYQEVTTGFDSPFGATHGGREFMRGTFQVRVMWPLAATTGDLGTSANGIGLPRARAEAIKVGFPRNLVLTGAGGQKVKIGERRITRGPPQGDRDVTIVRIRFKDR
jgi:hypothetical protein